MINIKIPNLQGLPQGKKKFRIVIISVGYKLSCSSNSLYNCPTKPAAIFFKSFSKLSVNILKRCDLESKLHLCLVLHSINITGLICNNPVIVKSFSWSLSSSGITLKSVAAAFVY
jgi:hypothetical protein